MAAELWVIEAHGKVECLQKALKTLGRDAEVFATQGHFMGFPKGLDPVGITKEFGDPLRGVTVPWVFDALREKAATALRVIIASDADQEGSAIAWDIAVAIRDIHKNPVRVPLRSLDEDSIRLAMTEVGPVTALAAAGPRARAIIDRLIGATFSRPNRMVGRVATAVLAAVDKRPPQLQRFVLIASASDGGPPFAAERIPASLIETQRLARAVKLKTRPVKPGEQALTGFPASDMGGMMASISDDALGRWKDPRPVRVIGDTMQRLYEKGRMSYPRSDAKGYGRSAIEKIRRNSDYRPPFGSDVQPNDDAALGDLNRVHDAPHPVGKFTIDYGIAGMASDEAVRVLAAQATVRALHAWPVQVPDPDDLQAAFREAGMPEEDLGHLCTLAWRRWDGAPPPGMTAWAEPAVMPRAMDAALVDMMSQLGLGRPSTWASHAERMEEKGMMVASADNTQLVLTDAGRASLSAAPEYLRSPRFTRALEAACLNPGPRTGEAPWVEIVAEVIGAQPMEMQTAMVAKAEPSSAYPLSQAPVRRPVLAPAPRLTPDD